MREFEQKIQGATRDVMRAMRSLVSRCQAIVDLAEYEDPMCPQARMLRGVKRELESAHATLGTLCGDRLQVERVNDAAPGGRHEKVVVKCVSSLMRGLDEREREGEGESAKRAPKAMQGHNAVVGVPELLDFLGNLGKTGVLEVQTLDETFTLVLEHGDVVYAMSNNSPAGLRLGDILVEQGAITLARLESELARLGHAQRPLGEVMAESAFITPEALQQALEYQCRQLFQRLFASEEATFTFRETGVPELGRVARMNVRTLLLESMLRKEGRAGALATAQQLAEVDAPFGATPPAAPRAHPLDAAAEMTQNRAPERAPRRPDQA